MLLSELDWKPQPVSGCDRAQVKSPLRYLVIERTQLGAFEWYSIRTVLCSTTLDRGASRVTHVDLDPIEAQAVLYHYLAEK